MATFDRTRLLRSVLPAVAIVLLVPAGAFADATLFLGSTTTPAGRLTRGFTIGASLVIVGFEFEYATTVEDETVAAPALTTGMGNLYAQTPFGLVQVYVLAGAGLYRERLQDAQETSMATAVGGGAKVALAGPLRLRIDYRLLNLRGSPRYSEVHRVYMGLNLLF